ncbi:acetolactate decarboxylase [Methanolobus sp. ZRKC2]|uniref:acetolactate decarboxylase n=1 Tax=Methanolobus sp. ZRKC2 TaxID=3125783 RepID=UPI00324A96B0
MRKNIVILAVFLLIIFTLISGCFEKPAIDHNLENINSQQTRETSLSTYNSSDILYQVSTINALLEGVYDGETDCKDLKHQGDFGIGTFSGLDGEMIELDGVVYQIKDDGIAYLANDSMTTPFAAVTFFAADIEDLIAEPMNRNKTEEFLSELMPNKNIMYAIKINGTFDYVKTRSVPKQEKPYPKLAEVTKSQPTFEFEEVNGTIVGYWLPSYIEEINVPGYHLHFITENKNAGGHVLEFNVTEAKVEIDNTYGFFMDLPENSDFLTADLSNYTGSEIERVER